MQRLRNDQNDCKSIDWKEKTKDRDQADYWTEMAIRFEGKVAATMSSLHINEYSEE